MPGSGMTPSSTAFDWSLGRRWVSPPAMPTTTHMVSMVVQLIKSVLYPGCSRLTFGGPAAEEIYGKRKGGFADVIHFIAAVKTSCELLVSNCCLGQCVRSQWSQIFVI